MSSSITSSHRRTAAPEGTDIEWLRCPGERAALVLCIVSNVVVVAAAVAVFLAGTAWLGAHPVLEKHVAWVRAVVITAVIALPATTLGRHRNLHEAINDGVRVGEDQFSELNEQLLRACRMLGLERVPEVYISRHVEGAAVAYSVWGGRSVVVLNAELLDRHWQDGLDWLTFAMAGALGSIRLGHTRWWIDLVTTYAIRIPGLRTPLLMRWTFSRDRCAAFVVPDGLRGLLVEAIGKHTGPNVHVVPFLTQVARPRGVWRIIAAIHQKAPLLTTRAHALYADGFFDRARDLKRDLSVTPEISPKP